MFFRWPSVKALPGADRLIKHLYSHKVPFALASNSSNEYIYAKIASVNGIFFFICLLNLFFRLNILQIEWHRGLN